MWRPAVFTPFFDPKKFQKKINFYYKRDKMQLFSADFAMFFAHENMKKKRPQKLLITSPNLNF